VNLSESRFAGQVGPHCLSPKCVAPVIWCRTQGNKQMLVDAVPVAYRPGQDFGTIKLADTADTMPLAVVLKERDRFGKQGHLHNSHFVTCPDAARFRRKGYER
jgi:hypothetical protein